MKIQNLELKYSNVSFTHTHTGVSPLKKLTRRHEAMANDRTNRTIRLVLFTTAFSLALHILSQAQKLVQFPENWTTLLKVEEGEVVKGNPLSSIIPGLHHTYLNDIAYEHFKKYIKDYKGGKPVPSFPEGSLIVLVNFEDKEGKKPRLFIVMHKDKEYGQTGGWGWEAFKPDKTRIVANPDKDCANCHYKSPKSWDGAFFSHVRE